MPWLNWSLKLHIRLRTISFLIFTRNTHVYVQWMPYSFVWLYLIKCVFTCSIFVDQSQKDFECFSCFLKVLCFYKNCQKISKNCIALFWQLSRMPQSWVHNRDFSRLIGNSLAGKCFNHEKYLEYFSKIWNFMLFAAQVGDLFASGRSSHKRYIEIFTAQFATLSQVELPVAKNT